MITSAKHSEWPLDTPISDLDSAGLPNASVVRMKLFTLDDQLVIRKSRVLANNDRKAVIQTFRLLLKLKRLATQSSSMSQELLISN